MAAFTRNRRPMLLIKAIFHSLIRSQPTSLGMLSLPYAVELNDLILFPRGLTGPDFLQIIKDQYEVLREDSETSGRVMALALHPFVIGQPFRAKYLDLALEYLAAQPDVWLTTSDEIYQHYRQSTGSAD